MKQPNIILIVADTMRRDAVGVYNKNIQSPNISKLAKDSVIYSNAISPSSWTLPSHASLFTGKYVNEHRYHEERANKNIMFLKGDRFLQLPTLAQRLSGASYRCLAHVQNDVISGNFGFDRGFDSYELDTGFHDYKNILENYFTDNQVKYILDHDVLKLLKSLIKEKKFEQIKVLLDIYFDKMKIGNNFRSFFIYGSCIYIRLKNKKYGTLMFMLSKILFCEMTDFA